MYKVQIKTASNTSAVDVSKLQDLEQAISFGFQLHQIASCKHFISVLDDSGVAVASFIRSDSFTLPAPKSDSLPAASEKKTLFKKK